MKPANPISVLSVLLVTVLAVATTHAQTPAALIYDAKSGPVAFGAGDLQTARSPKVA